MGKVNDIKPQIFLRKSDLPTGVQVVNLFDKAIEELFVIDNPQYKDRINRNKELFFEYISHHQSKKKTWIYYPQNSKVFCTVGERDYLKLRTARNRNVITTAEQEQYRNIRVGIIGLSIGSVVLSSLVYTGGPKHIKIADYDVIEISNLNRMWADLLDVGSPKVYAVASKVWQVDPYADIEIREEKITDETIFSFLCGESPVDVFIDAMDSLPLKVRAREICKQKKIPVIMATSNGDGVIIDIERYDIEENIRIFNGRLGEIHPSDFIFTNYKEWLQKALELVDKDILAPRVIESIDQLGVSLSSIPQLSTTVHLGASAVSYAVRKIATNQKLSSGRYLINIQDGIK